MAPVMVEVRGSYRDRNDEPAAGTVRFLARSVGAGDGSIVLPVPVVVTLDAEGAFAVELQATDDPGFVPSDFTYRVIERFGAFTRSYDIGVAASYAGTGVDLADLAPVDSAEGEFNPVPGPTGATGATGATGPEGPSVMPLAVARFDAANAADGTVATLDTGQTVTNFGNFPITVSGGILQHSSGGAQSAGYIQLDAGSRVRRIGLTASWPAASTGAIAIVIPSAPWSTGVLPVAGIHLVMFGNGIWHCARWNMGETTYADYTTHGRYSDVRDGALRPIDLWIDADADTCTLFFPDGSSTQFTSAFIGDETAQWAIWELYETFGAVDLPASIGEIWADTYTPSYADVAVNKPALVDVLDAKAPVVLYEGTNSGAVDINASGAIPPGVKWLEAIVIGGSGGGGSGACSTAGTAANGGSAGGSAGIWRESIPASAFTGISTYSVVVGRRGLGGAAVSSNGAGVAGTAGTQSRVVLGGMAISAFAGGGGPAGTQGASAGAAGAAGGPFATGGAAGTINGGVGANGSGITATPGTPGSGSGGGVTTGGVANNGGAGGANLLRGFAGGTAGVAGGAAPGVGTDAALAALTTAVAGCPGPGVGGGAGNASGAAQAGATPLLYGVGGGGGGGSVAPNASGAGGNGIGGYVLLRAHFI